MSHSTPQELTSQEQIYALQQELIQVREKGRDRTSECVEDHRSAAKFWANWGLLIIRVNNGRKHW